MNLPTESNENSKPGINVHEVLRSFFKHKWKVLFFALAGLGSAAYVWFTRIPEFESKAKVYVKYVIEWNKDEEKALSNYAESVIQPEVEILTSWDIARDVVEKVGATRIVSPSLGAGATGAAVVQVMQNFEVKTSKGNKVIGASYKHPDPEITVLVLNEILTAYKRKHIAIHRPSDIFELVDQQKTEIHNDLGKLETKLKELKAKADINNLSDSASSINAILTSTQLDLSKASVQLEAQRARVGALEKLLGVNSRERSEESAKVDALAPDPLKIQEYRAIAQRRERALLKEEELLLHREAGSVDVKVVRNQIKAFDADLEARRKATPGLDNVPVTSLSREMPKIDLTTERAELQAAEAQHAALKAAYAGVLEKWKNFVALAPMIESLEKEKKSREAAYEIKFRQAEDARTAQVIDAKKMTNIEVIQMPSPPAPATDKLIKIVMGLGVGGLVLGLSLAFVREFVLDQSVRQPLELESRLGIPLILSIPENSGAARLQSGKGEPAEIMPWRENHFIRPYADAIRDRLVLYFEQKGLIRKPKLVGFTGWTMGAGTSTLATGVAAALSETGDGKVLLVDMNIRGGEVHPFFKGESAALLPDALKSSENIQSTAENLYIATATTQNGETEIIPKRFYNLIPNFKASDYDYIIFDMPPLSKGSMTLAMAGFMDRMLLVVEAEKDNRNVLKRACAELLSAKANLCGVLNKARTYGPGWLQEA